MRALPLLLALTAGCTYEEGMTIADLTGTVVLPEEAVTRTFQKQDGTEETLTDPRLIGPVYLGLFSGVQDGLKSYTHPLMGPMFQPGVPGDTYPYAGTTVGDLPFPCFESLVCKVSSGRYTDFDNMVDWFTDVIETPIVDAYGDEVDTGDYVRQTCYDLMHYTTDEEVRLTATTDRNEDGVIDLKDLDFVQGNDGKFYADFTIWQTQYVDGFTLWGWMDAPSEVSHMFSTCDPSQGYQESTYSSDFAGGMQYPDLLNSPSLYISSGDWVVSSGGTHTYSSPDDHPEIHLDFLVTE
ncbi:MAG: hypothetical protein JXX28_07515 [Deltaproteobacteria bacterium]|nr:hypothetical protein [Deltaproteobacteria bacterium]